MPKEKKRELTPSQKKALIEQLKIGIAAVESSGWAAKGEGKEYEAVPGDKNNDGKPDSGALGKYQFVKKYWWVTNDEKNIKGIKSFAKEQGVFGDIEKWEDVSGNAELQEAYFEYYADKVLIPNALSITENPLNLSLTEIASQFHFQAPHVARKGITTGNLTAATSTNVSGLKYVKVVRNAIEKSGLKPITNHSVISEKNENEELTKEEKKIKKTNEEIKADFKKRDQAITNNPYVKNPEALRAKLYQEAVDNGYDDLFNEYIEEDNKKRKQDIIDYNEIVDFAEKLEYEQEEVPGSYQRDSDGKLIEKNGKVLLKNRLKTAQFFEYDESDSRQYKKLNDKYNFSSSDQQTGFSAVDPKKLFAIISEKHKNLTGEDLNLSAENIGSDDNFNIKGAGLSGLLASAQDLADFQGANPRIDLSIKNKAKLEYKERKLIDRNIFKPKEIIAPEDVKDDSSNDDESKGGKVLTDTSKIPVEEENNTDSIEKYFQQQLSLGEASASGNDYSLGETKQELPIDALTGLALGLIGNEQAKSANIPLRTEEVSDAVKMFTAELAKRSEMGLPVEVEAKMKNDLADTFQAGLANIVNASAGNRATILGNLGGLDNNKNKGNVAIQMADYQAKEKAFEQYGNALMYENDFNANRDIANHQIKYNQGLIKQKEGKDLATAGFAKLIDAVKYQKENGPGSANDQYRSLLMQDMFGFDPKMKDDGTGNVKGTKSYFDKKKALTDQNLKYTKEMYKKFSLLTPEQKKAANTFSAETSDTDSVNGFINHLIENPDLNLNKLSMDNLDLFSKDKDYLKLFQGRYEAANNIKLKPNEIMLSENELNNAKSGSLNPMTENQSSVNTNNGILDYDGTDYEQAGIDSEKQDLKNVQEQFANMSNNYNN